MNMHRLDSAELAPRDHVALVECPTCGLPAEIADRFTLDGAPAPVEHVKLVCVSRHWYTLPVDQMASSPARPDEAERSGGRQWTT